MRTSASEHLSQDQVMARLASTFSALVKEQIDAVERFLEREDPDLDTSDIAGLVELAVRLVERSSEWLGVSEMASLALELRETLLQLGQLRPEHRQEMVAHCRVALDAEARLAEKLRTEGFGALVHHAGIVSDAVEQLRAGLSSAKAQNLSASRGVIDEAVPNVGPSENLLALTFEIKNALVHQNDRIASMSETVGETLRSAQTATAEWEAVVKKVERRRMQAGAKAGDDPLEGKALLIHQELQDTTSGLRTLSQELGQLLSLQYALERRARDLDENLLWEFLDPLDRYVDDLYSAVTRRDGENRRTMLTLQTGGVGFEPEIGSLLLPLLVRLLESAKPCEEGCEEEEIRLTAAREGLEARIALEGTCCFDESAESALMEALAGLGGFATIERLMPAGTSIHLQFPMARSLRSFLIVEAAGQRIAVPWSAVERIHASPEDMSWDGAPPRPIHALASLFSTASANEDQEPQASETAPAAPGRPVAVIRSGGASVVVGFDRIVWRENARLTPLPARLYPVDEVLGGIVAPDNGVTLVLNPAGVIRRLAAEGE
jgi:chemotaxis protein histidine kinase CheA